MAIKSLKKRSTKNSGDVWDIIFSYRPAKNQPLKTVQKRGFKRKKDAQAYYKDYIKKHELNCSDSYRSFIENQYLPDRQLNRAKGTFKGDISILKTYLIPYFGDIALCEITTGTVRDFQNWMKQEYPNHSSSYRKKIHKILQTSLQYACDFFDLKENVAKTAGCKDFGQYPSKKSINFYTTDEFEKLISVIENPHDHLAFNILFYTGLRIGELRGLTLKDIDLENGLIHITHQKTEDNEDKPLKTGDLGIRDVPTKAFHEELENYIKNQYDLKPTDYLFQYVTFTYERHLHKYAKEAGLKKIKLHDLRHSCVSYLMHEGMTLANIGKLMGHTTTHMTERYTHWYPKAEIEEYERIFQEGTKVGTTA